MVAESCVEKASRVFDNPHEVSSNMPMGTNNLKLAVSLAIEPVDLPWNGGFVLPVVIDSQISWSGPNGFTRGTLAVPICG